MGNFRPIFCCNVIYKIITKILANRIKEVLKDLINTNQAAFILGRKIGDNIFLTQELVKEYHKNGGPVGCIAKIDIMKAYDSIHLGFLMDSLEAYGFPDQMRMWIKVCISTPRFSININGELAGYKSRPVHGFVLIFAWSE